MEMQKSSQNIFVPVSRKRSLQLKPIYFLFVGLTPASRERSISWVCAPW